MALTKPRNTSKATEASPIEAEILPSVGIPDRRKRLQSRGRGVRSVGPPRWRQDKINETVEEKNRRRFSLEKGRDDHHCVWI